MLEPFATDLRRDGVVGEDRLAKLVYLALTTRLLARRVSLAVKGPSSAGKSYVTGKVISFFPEDACHVVTAMSERVLAYGQEPLEHRMLVVFEADGVSGEFGQYLLRSLLSEGRLAYETVDKTNDGLAARRIEREGPTGLLVTTKLAMHAENETRLLSVEVSDMRAQTRSILVEIANDRSDTVDRAPWIALQSWLALAPSEVVIPYAALLADVVDDSATRMRRDFSALLSLIHAHALLHRDQRAVDGRGRVTATIADYAGVHALVSDLIAAGVEQSAPATVRDTVGAVRSLLAAKAPVASATTKEIAAELGLDPSAASRRLSAARRRGFLENDAVKGRPAQWALADPLPDDRAALPAPNHLARLWGEASACARADDAGD